MSVSQLSMESSSPVDWGFNEHGVTRLLDVLSAGVERGSYPGFVVLIARGGQTVLFEARGHLTPDHRKPMQKDAVFRIYSMTKLVTSMLAMMLVERGVCLLDDPISDYLPEFKKAKVLSPKEASVEAERDIRIYDLLRQTSGLGGGVWGTVEISRRYRNANVPAFEHLRSNYALDIGEVVRRISTVPLAHQPGTVWEYGKSGDVLGHVLELVAGRRLDELLTEMLARPLELIDLGFWLSEDQIARLAQPAKGGEILDTARETPAFLSGGSGAFSTAFDFAVLAQTLLDKGRARGASVLSRKAVELMCSDHLDVSIDAGPDYIPGAGYGFGLGLAVRKAAGGSPFPGSDGDLYWLGRAGTCFIIDPREELIGVLMVQRYWWARKLQSVFRTLLYSSLD